LEVYLPMKQKVIRDLISVGRFLFESGVVDYYSGNLSVKWKNKIFITRSGSPLPFLKPQDVVVIAIDKPLVGKPSSEFIVHRAIYEKTEYKAVAHAHPPSVVSLAFNYEGNFFTPIDNEGKLLLGQIPIIRVEKPSASVELAEAVSEFLKNFPCAIVYSHGVFCASSCLKKAAGLITALESSAKILLKVKMTERRK